MKCEMLVGYLCDEFGDAGDEVWCTREATEMHEGVVRCCERCADGLRAEGFQLAPMPVVVLAQYYDAGIEFRVPPIVLPETHLATMAVVAKEDGCDLMFEFDSQPDMAELARLAPEGKVSSMSNMVRLWVLADLEARDEQT